MHGETIVLRLLRNLNVSSDLAALGFDDEARRKIFQLAQSSNGMVVVTGPTGSGKTTTLYSLVSLLNKEGVKIFTIEDPVEYQLEGITQLQVNSAIALDFARSLRSVLRQDPDIILVGEIRDKETAQIAIQAALTGHLVLTTLHTNTAAGAFTRLRDMGIEEYLIASTIRGVIAQRLVRLLCPSCRDGDASQCPTCRGTQYSGRTVIYEVLEAGGGLASLLGSSATEAEIVEQAVSNGMTTMAACASKIGRGGSHHTAGSIARSEYGDGHVTRFSYRAYGKDGTETKGVIDAGSRLEAARLVSKSGGKLVDLREETVSFGTIPAIWAKITPQNSINYHHLFSELAILLQAGFTIDAALKAIAGSQKGKTGLAEIIEAIRIRQFFFGGGGEARRRQSGGDCPVGEWRTQWASGRGGRGACGHV